MYYINPTCLTNFYLFYLSDYEIKIKFEAHKVITDPRRGEKLIQFRSDIMQIIDSPDEAFTKNMPKVFAFIENLRNPWEKMLAYKILRNAFYIYDREKTTQFLTFIYFIREEMSHNVNDTRLLQEYENIKESLPKSMRAIVFQEFVHILNREYKEYMYECGWKIDNQGMILSWVPRDVVFQSYFYFDPKHDNGTTYFYIRNDYYNHGAPICAGPKLFNEKLRYTLSCPGSADKKEMKWYLHVQDDNYTTIQSYDEAYLYASESFHDKDRRFLFTWLGDQRDISRQQNAHWLIFPAE